MPSQRTNSTVEGSRWRSIRLNAAALAGSSEGTASYNTMRPPGRHTRTISAKAASGASRVMEREAATDDIEGGGRGAPAHPLLGRFTARAVRHAQGVNPLRAARRHFVFEVYPCFWSPAAPTIWREFPTDSGYPRDRTGDGLCRRAHKAQAR